MMEALAARKEQESDRFTAAVAEAIAISVSEKALDAWKARLGIGQTGRAPISAEGLALVMRRFPGAIKVN